MVEPSGPPSVKSLIESKTRMEPIIVTMATIKTVGISKGNLIFQNSEKDFAPSMRAASITSSGIFLTAPIKINTFIPRFFKTRVTITLNIAQPGCISQFGPSIPKKDKK